MNTDDNKRRVRRFYEAVSGRDKPRELLGQFVLDPELIQHVLTFEAAFPRYAISKTGTGVAVQCPACRPLCRLVYFRLGSFQMEPWYSAAR